MKLVGATSGFIRRPLAWKYNIVSGIFASILAILMLTGALYYLQNELKGFIRDVGYANIIGLCGSVCFRYCLVRDRDHFCRE